MGTVDRAKIGRNNRKRGVSIEKEACDILGVRHIGALNQPEDGGDSGDWITVQVKSGGAYPERIDRWLRAIHARGDQIRAVILADTPGPGHKRRWLIAMDLQEYLAAHRLAEYAKGEDA